MSGTASLLASARAGRRIWKEKWVGQEQDWYLGRFLGTRDANIATEHPEFREWKWVEPNRLPSSSCHSSASFTGA